MSLEPQEYPNYEKAIEIKNDYKNTASYVRKGFIANFPLIFLYLALTQIFTSTTAAFWIARTLLKIITIFLPSFDLTTIHKN